MARPGFIDRQQLGQWANSISSRSEFPRLVRRLVLETGRGVTQVGFPTGEGVGLGDWDGTVRATEQTEFIPQGLSLWELSVEKSVGRKADRDYVDRTTTPDGSPTQECTYVAGSLRPFRDRAQWARERTQQARWKEVRAYGLDNIETWLEAAPVTHAWISDVLRLGPYGLRSAEFWWEDWSSATTPKLAPSVVLAGRADQEKALCDRLARDPQLITIKAGSIQEVLAFIAATLIRAAEAGNAQQLVRTAFVNDLVTWRALLQHQDPLVLVPLDQAVAEARAAMSHHVIVPVVSGSMADIELPPIDAAEATSALKAAGLEDERKSDSAGRLARRSLVALRRRLANKPELDQPPWARPPVDRQTRGILLSGAWQDETKGDQEILESLTGVDYETLRETLATLAAEEDPVIAAVDRTWALVSPYDAWLQLRDSLREDDLERLGAVIRQVLLEVDPALELRQEERWRASIEGKVHAYSGDLRHALAVTMALLAVHGEHVNAEGSVTGVDCAEYLVRQILEAANSDESSRLWASLSYILPLLAESAPANFLDAVHTGLQGDEPVLAGLFTDREDTGVLGPSPAHTGLLWALETVAWSEEHFSYAVDRLARLAELDPGGQWADRPLNSLRSIFCPWHPDTSVDVDRRLKVINTLRQRYPETAWQLMLALLPGQLDVHNHTHRPEFREWVPSRKLGLRADHSQFVRALVPPLIKDARKSAARWDALIEKTTMLPSEDRATVRNSLAEQLEKGDIETDGLQDLWASLRAFIAKHREFAQADWRLPKAELVELEKIEQSIAPDEPSLRLAWLFKDHRPDLGEEHQRKDDHEGYEKALDGRRRDALEEIETVEGFDGVCLLAQQSLGWFVGSALAEATRVEYDDDVLPLIDGEDPTDLDFVRGYLTRRYLQDGWEWVTELLKSDPPLSATQRARLLLETRDVPKAWELADDEGPEVAEAFWQSFSPLGLGQDFPHVADVVQGLFHVGREAAALDMLSMYSRDKGNDPEELVTLISEGLDRLFKKGADDPELRALSQYDLQSLFSYLEEHRQAIGWERVARLEWAYLGALGYDANVPTLNRLLASDPDFFVQVITAIYRPRSAEKDEEPSPEAQRVATNAYRLLYSWNGAPGVAEDGTLDGDSLRDWVSGALRKLEEADRKETGEVRIGHVLAYAPAGSDGIRPAPEVRNLLEEIQSDQVEKGLQTEFYNQRGITSRGPEEGGGRERDLAKQYQEQAGVVADEWPRTATILRNLAKSYEHDARYNETKAERQRQGLDP